MKKTLLIALALVAICIMPSCEKDPKPGEEPNEPTTDRIVFGNYEGMDVVTYDNIEWDYFEAGVSSTCSKSFDVNNDGKMDFSLRSIARANPNGDPSFPKTLFSIFIESILGFHGEEVISELYFHNDSTVTQTDSIPLIYIYTRRTCHKMNEFDIFDCSYNLTHIFSHGKNDAITIDDTFKTSSRFVLFESDEEFPYHPVPEVTEATVYQNLINAPYECYNFPLEEEVYIGFKYIGENTTRLGWIKIIIESDSNGYLIARPLETAIQKEYKD